MSKLIGTLKQMIDDAELYTDLLYIFPGSMRVGVELTDTGETATLLIGEESRVEEGLVDPVFKITMTAEILEKIMKREVDAFALAGRSHIKETRPIDFEFIDNSRVNEAMEAIKGLTTFFFNPGKIKRRELRLGLAGEAHGARPIPIVYWKGVRYAWYHVPAGKILNEEGEKDPWPQAFVVLRGKGKILIEHEEFKLQAQMVYYIPRNCTHQVHADKVVELLWLAWDAE